LLFNTGTEPVISKNGLLTTVGYDFPGQKPVFALEGSIAVAGSAVKWARDQLGIIKNANEIGELASKVDGIRIHLICAPLTVDTAGVVFVTAFSGLWAPYWRSDVQGTICNPPLSASLTSKSASQATPPNPTSAGQSSKA
jgi:glycerol kinase